MDNSAYSHVLVDTAADDNIVTLLIAVYHTKNAILPLYFDTVNSDLKLSASIDCAIKYQITFDFELDTDKGNNDDMINSTNTTFYAYFIDIQSIEGDFKNSAKVVYNSDFYNVALSEEYK